MSKDTLQLKKLTLERQWLQIEKEEVDIAMQESETELRSLDWYRNILKKIYNTETITEYKKRVIERSEPPEPDFDTGLPYKEDAPQWLKDRWANKGFSEEWVSETRDERKKEYRKTLKNLKEESEIYLNTLPQGMREIFEKIFKQEEPKETAKDRIKDPRIRKIYYKIVEKAHPDKAGEEFLKQFLRASRAYQEKDTNTLLDTAAELNIKIPKGLAETRIEALKVDIENIKALITENKGSLGWTWAQAKTEEEKEIIAKRICQRYGIEYT